MWSTVAQIISQTLGEPFTVDKMSHAGGGCINDAVVIEGSDRRFFVKLNRRNTLTMFEAETAGLLELAKTNAVRAPKPVCTGIAGDRAFLVLEHISLRRASSACTATFGTQLARLHATTRPTFGWDRDNTIGSTEQPNRPNADWVSFWQEQRLDHQLTIAKSQGHSGSVLDLGKRVIEITPRFFTTYHPRPALLHGDLWGGNFAMDEAGAPVIFDPAVYYGDREADIAMTELFGGFGSAFYSAYEEAAPLDPGYSVRKVLYNLYHVLNHLNLFGGGYSAQAEDMMERLLSEA